MWPSFFVPVRRHNRDPDATPGEKGREVFKGAFQQSPRKSPRAGMSGESEYALSASSSWQQKRRFLTSPVPVGAGILQCKVIRNRKKDTFVLWLEKTRPTNGSSVEFLLVGKQRKGAKATLTFVVSMDETDHSRHGRGCVGKLCANLRSTEYILYDQGLNPTLAGNRRKVSCAALRSRIGKHSFVSCVLICRLRVPAITQHCGRNCA